MKRAKYTEESNDIITIMELRNLLSTFSSFQFNNESHVFGVKRVQMHFIGIIFSFQNTKTVVIVATQNI